MNKAIAVKTSEGTNPVTELALFKKHRGVLTTLEYDHEDDNGTKTRRLWPMEKVNEYTRLIPKDECLGLIGELEAALIPAHYDQARELTETILGRYAKRDLYNIDTFVFEMTRLFAEAPADLGQAASDKLRDRRFLPNVGDVTGILKPMVNERHRALSQARKHLKEHQRRGEERQRREKEFSETGYWQSNWGPKPDEAA